MQETKELYTGPKTLQMNGTPSHKVKWPELVKYTEFLFRMQVVGPDVLKVGHTCFTR